MGTDLGDLIEPEEISFDEMNDRIIAVDAMNTLYQFLSIIRQRDGTPLKDSEGRVTSHLSGLFYRTGKLFRKNIDVVYVFDGETPELKAKESAERRKKREEAREEWQELKEEGKLEEAFTKATQSAEMNEEMILESKELLDAMGVPYVQAPSEGEAQAAQMNREGSVWAVGGQDWDSLLFGAARMVRNLAITGKRKKQGGGTKEVSPERIEADAVFADLDITQEKLVWMGVMVGTDYNPGGIHGIGPKTALDLVHEYDSLDALQEDEKWEWEHEPTPETIVAVFMDPPVEEDAAFELGEPDRDRILEVLVEEHGFSADRVESSLEKYLEARSESQSSLDTFR
ncbi:MAG: flap endonuclease-1 [Candidatus Nanohaloarchaea archaeon]|nr:flap endonuclease-1 [Candidatus Nanohaloarchaea archaeon]